VLFAAGIRKSYPINDSPRSLHPIDLVVLRDKYPVVGGRATVVSTNIASVNLGGEGKSLECIGLIDYNAQNSNSNFILLAKSSDVMWFK
jgi:hypothetical protein